MRLSDASSYFMKEQITDAYSGDNLFLAQTASFDDHASSGATARRRTMSVKYGTTMPARNAVGLLGNNWIVGAGIPDGFQGNVVRVNYSLKESTGLLAKLTPGQACLAAAGVPMHAHCEFFKDSSNLLSESDTGIVWNIFSPVSEAVGQGAFFRDASSRLYRVKSLYDTADGFRVAESDDLGVGNLHTAVFTENGTYNTTTDSFATTSITTGCIQVDQSNFYRFFSPSEADRRSGDTTVFVAASAVTPKVGTAFTMAGVRYTVLQAVAEADSWALRVRLA